MKLINIICSPKTYNEFEIKVIPDIYALEDTVYIMPTGISLEDYAQEWKDKVKSLESRYAYLERGRNWAIKNFRRLVK